MELDESLFDFEEEQRKAQERANDQVTSDMIKEREKGSLGDKIEAEELKYQRYIKAMENGARLTTQRGSNFISKSEDSNGIMVSDRVAEYLLANLKLKEIRSNSALGTCDYVLDKDLSETYKVVDKDGDKVSQGGGFSTKDEAELFAAQYGEKDLKVVKEALTSRQLKSPKRYIYELCNYLGWNVPLFTDLAAGGYRLRYLSDSKEEAQKGLDELLNAAKELNIKVKRPRIVPNRYEPKDNNIFNELVKKYNLPTTTIKIGGEDYEAIDWDTIHKNKPDNFDAFHDEAYYMTYYFAVAVPRYEAPEEELKEEYKNEFTIEINNEIYCDDNGEAYHFDSYVDAQEFIEENELENTSIVRQYGKAKYEEALDSQPLNQKELSDNGLATVINTLIKDEWDAIQAYNDAIITFEAEGKNDLVQVLQDILNEENLHVGQLETLLEQVSGSANSIDAGKAEAEVQLTQNESPENTIEDEEDPEEGMHY